VDESATMMSWHNSAKGELQQQCAAPTPVQRVCRCNVHIGGHGIVRLMVKSSVVYLQALLLVMSKHSRQQSPHTSGDARAKESHLSS
jgi:hypothetical protein